MKRLYRYIKDVMMKILDDLKLNITEEMKFEDADYEVDELCQFVQKKKSKVWIWVVLHRETRQIVAFHMGGRGIKDCKKLWKKLEDLGIKGKLHTDLWKAYASVFPKNQHHPHEYRGVETILRGLPVLFAQGYLGLFEDHTRLQNPIEIYI